MADRHNPFTFSLGSGPVTKQTKGGVIQIADSHNFKVSTTIAAALVTIHPGGMREMHWHPNADEWQYYVKGSAEMTVFNTGPAAVTNNFKAGDIGYVKANFGHYVKNVGDADLVFRPYPPSLSSHGDERVACGRCGRLKLRQTEAFRALGSTT